MGVHGLPVPNPSPTHPNGVLLKQASDRRPGRVKPVLGNLNFTKTQYTRIEHDYKLSVNCRESVWKMMVIGITASWENRASAESNKSETDTTTGTGTDMTALIINGLVVRQQSQNTGLIP